MIKLVAVSTLASSLLLMFACYSFIGINSALSSATGSGVMLVNLFGIWLCWKLVFFKKSIALAVLVIIFKYLILGLILWNFTKYQWLQPVGFIIGISSLLLGMISAVFIKKINEPSDKG